jgi:16S rRNA (adenine1518-N6/adenine1519-N6)-dimethyltransferase
MCQISTEASYMLTVPPEAFRPAPKVFSAVVQLIPRPRPLVSDSGAFLQFASQCFTQKRKTLRNNLLAAYGAERVEAQPEAKLRAEQLSVEQLADLYGRLTA